MKAKLVKNNLNESYKIILNNKKIYGSENKKGTINFLVNLKKERPNYFTDAKVFVDNIEITPEQFIFINKNSSDEEANILINIYKKVKAIIPNIKIYFSNTGGVLIPSSKISEKQHNKLFKVFDVENDDYFITDDAGPNDEYIGIYLTNEENID